jgi:ABC-type amino acid transport substrate-binding protein
MPIAPVSTETVRMSHQSDFAPFIYVKNGKSVGILVDIVEAAAARENIKVVFVPVPLADVAATLTDGRADAIVPFGITPERQAAYDFSAPLVMTGGALFVKAPSPEPLDLHALDGKTVVSPQAGPFVVYMQKNAPGIHVVATTSYQDSLNRVVSGEADAAALNLQVGTNVVAESYAGKITVPVKTFSQAPLAIAVTKGRHADLMRRLADGLEAIRADGTLARIEAKWKSPPR